MNNINNILIMYYPFYSGCRLGNQLYFALNCYKLRKYNNNIFMVVNQQLAEIFNYLNINFYKVSNTYNCLAYNIQNNESGHLKLFQTFNKCFNKTLLNEFIKNTISKKINYDVINNNTVCIQIRAGDYLIAQPDYTFNYFKFLTESLNNINTKENYICHIYSDDIFYCKNVYNNFLKKYFNVIEYKKNINPQIDLLRSANYKLKIIWNSTFAYWSAYISNYLFNNEKQIYVPDYHCKTCNNMKAWQLNPNWNIIKELK